MKRYSKITKFISLAFLIYFSVYAASPLLYSYDKNGMPAANCAADASAAYCKGSHIFLYELICSNLLDKTGNDTQKTAKIFLLKKRAVLSDADPQKLLKADAASFDSLHYQFEGGRFSGSLVIADQKSSDNSERLHSGLSPPSV